MDLSGELISTLAGVILGFVLSEARSWLRDRKRRTEERDSLRTLLRLELDQNLSQLRSWWESVQHAAGADNAAHTRAVLHRLLTIGVPAWSNLMLRSNASGLPSALSSEELTHVLRVYAHLEQVSVIERQLVEIKRRDEARQHATPEARDAFGKPIGERLPRADAFEFERQGPAFWQALRAIVEPLLNESGVGLLPVRQGRRVQ